MSTVYREFFSAHSRRLFAFSAPAEIMKLFLILSSTQLTVIHQPLLCRARMYRNLLLRKSGASVKIICIRKSVFMTNVIYM